MMQQLSLTERLHIAAVQISADASLAGVQRLRAHWGDRHTVVAVRIPADLQKESISVLAARPLPLLLEDRASELAELRQRALPCVFLDLTPSQLAAEIRRGFRNDFDLRFVDKSLSRIGALQDRWIGPGTHRLHPVERWRPSGAPPRSPRPSPSPSPCRRICCCAASTTCRIT